MINIKDIQEIPVVNTMWVTVSIFTCICPTIIAFYYSSPELFHQLDFLKIILLTASSGLSILLINLIISMVIVLSYPERLGKLRSDRSIAFIFLYANFAIFIALLITYAIVRFRAVKDIWDLTDIFLYSNISFHIIPICCIIIFNSLKKTRTNT